AAVPAEPEWGMRRDYLSPSYMTDFNQLWKVSCR
ncbi:ultraviolet light resistance protein B, partial [Pseudomonas simiae]